MVTTGSKMKNDVSSVFIIFALLVFTVQGAKENENGSQKGVGENELNIRNEKYETITGENNEYRPRGVPSIDGSKKDLNQSRVGKAISTHKRTRRHASLPQETEDHDLKSSLQNFIDHEVPTRSKREAETPINGSYNHTEVSAKRKRKSAKLKLVSVCRSGKASKKFLNAIEKASNEDSGEKISLMGDDASLPFIGSDTSLIQGAKNDNPFHPTETLPYTNGLQTDIEKQNQGSPELEMSPTRDNQPSTGAKAGDQQDQNVINNLASTETNSRESDTDKETAPSMGTLKESTVEPSRGQQWLPGLIQPTPLTLTGNNDSNRGPNKTNENVEQTHTVINPEIKEFIPSPSKQPAVITMEYGQSAATPSLISTASVNLSTIQKNETHHHDDRPLGTNSEESPLSSTSFHEESPNLLPPFQNKLVFNKNEGTPLKTTASYEKDVPAAAGIDEENRGSIGTPDSQTGTGHVLPIFQKKSTHQKDKSNQLAENSYPLPVYSSATNQQTPGIIQPLQSQPSYDNSKGTLLETTASYEKDGPAAAGIDEESRGLIGTPDSQTGTGHVLPIFQKKSTHQKDKSNQLAENSDLLPLYSSATNLQTPGIIQPLQSQPSYDNSKGTLLETTANYEKDVPVAAGIDEENRGSIGTPDSQTGTGHVLPIFQKKSTHQKDKSNQLAENSDLLPLYSSATNLQTPGIIQPLQSQPSYDNSKGTLLETTASYEKDGPAAAGIDEESRGLIGTPDSQTGTVHVLPIFQKKSTHQKDKSNQLAENSDLLPLYSSATNQQTPGIIQPLQSQPSYDNSKGTLLETTASYEKDGPAAAGIDEESRGLIGTPDSQTVTVHVLPIFQKKSTHQKDKSNQLAENSDPLPLYSSATNQQTPGIIQPLQSQPSYDNSKGTLLESTANYEKDVPAAAGIDEENRGSIGTPDSQTGTGHIMPIFQKKSTHQKDKSNQLAENSDPLPLYSSATNQQTPGIIQPLQSQPSYDNSKGTLLETTASYEKDGPAAAGIDEESRGLIGTPDSQTGTGHILPIFQKKSTHQKDKSNQLAENSDPLPLYSSATNQQTSGVIQPLQSQPSYDNSKGTLLETTASYEKDGPAAAGIDEESRGSISTPDSQTGTGQILPIIHKKSINQKDKSNQLAENSYPLPVYSSATNQQTPGIIQPLQSQPSYDNSKGTLLETTASYEKDGPAAAGIDEESRGLIGTPDSQTGTGHILPIFQKKSTHKKDKSNQLAENSDPLPLYSSAINQQTPGIIQPLQSQPSYDNSKGTLLETTASYEKDGPAAAGIDEESRGLIGTPDSQTGTGHILPIFQKKSTHQKDKSNQLAENSDLLPLYSSATNQQTSGVIQPLQSQPSYENSKGTLLETTARYEKDVPAAAGIDEESRGLIGTPDSQTGTGHVLPIFQKKSTHQKDKSNQLAENSYPLPVYSSATNQQTPGIIQPLQSQPSYDNSKGTLLETTASYEKDGPAAAGIDEESRGLIGTPDSQTVTVHVLPIFQKKSTHQKDKSNQLAENSDPLPLYSSATNQQTSGVIQPLQSQPSYDNSKGTLLETTASYEKDGPAAAGIDEESRGLIGTPDSQTGTGHVLPIFQKKSTHQKDKSNQLAENSDPLPLYSSATNQQTSGVIQPLQSQPSYDNSKGTLLETTASYEKDGPAAAGIDEESRGLIGTPDSQTGTGHILPIFQKKSTHQKDKSNQLAENSYPLGHILPASKKDELYKQDGRNSSDTYTEASPLSSSLSNQQMTSIRPSLQSQTTYDNPLDGTHLDTIASYVKKVPTAAGKGKEISGFSKAPASQFIAGVNSPTNQNVHSFHNPLAANSEPLQSSSYIYNPQIPSIRPILQSQPIFENGEGKPLEMIDVDVHRVPAASVIGEESSGLRVTPTFQFSAGVDLPNTQGQSYHHDKNIPLATDSETSIILSSTSNPQPPNLIFIPSLQSQPIAGSYGIPLDSSTSYGNGIPETAMEEKDIFLDNPESYSSSSLIGETPKIFSWPSVKNTNIVPTIVGSVTQNQYETDPDKLSGSQLFTTDHLPSVLNELKRNITYQEGQKLTPSLIASQLMKNPNYTTWSQSKTEPDGHTKPKCVCTCDNNQHFLIW